MSQSFTATATRLAGMIPRLLGWRPADFWEATPMELAAILSADDAAAGEALTRTELTTLLERDSHG